MEQDALLDQALAHSPQAVSSHDHADRSHRPTAKLWPAFFSVFPKQDDAAVWEFVTVAYSATLEPPARRTLLPVALGALASIVRAADKAPLVRLYEKIRRKLH